MLVNLVLWTGPQVHIYITAYILSCHTHGKKPLWMPNPSLAIFHRYSTSWHAAFIAFRRVVIMWTVVIYVPSTSMRKIIVKLSNGGRWEKMWHHPWPVFKPLSGHGVVKLSHVITNVCTCAPFLTWDEPSIEVIQKFNNVLCIVWANYWYV